MKRILFFFVALSLSVGRELRAQDPALVERVDKLNGYVQDLLEDKANQKKQMESLAKEIQGLRDQQSKANTTYATQEDLRKLAVQLQEIDKKRESDKELILKEIEKLGRTLTAVPPARRPTQSTPAPGENVGTSDLSPGKGDQHVVQADETLLAIVKAYKDIGIKVTLDQILQANPGLDPNNLKVGQKITIPAPKP